jgi:hypothetical protein
VNLVISQRVFLRLLQALAALLLSAAVPLGGGSRAHDGVLIGTVESSSKTGSLSDQPARGHGDAALAAYLDVDDEQDQHVEQAPHIRPADTWCAAVVAVVITDPSPPATHRCCAAPPTGPPHA